MKELKIENYDILIFIPNKPNGSIFYTHRDESEDLKEISNQVENIMGKNENIIVGIGGIDWNHDLTPWPAKKVFRKEEDFSGDAKTHLEFLLSRIIPEVEDFICEDADIAITERYIAGHSLGGLFALYAATKTDLFNGIASISGSMWYDGFVEYIEDYLNNNKLLCKKVYLSLGQKETETKNLRMQQVEDKTDAICELLDAEGIEVFYELNPGNHFTETEIRIAKGISWLTKGE